MKKLVLLIALVATVCTGSAFAQGSGWENNMGIYFDAEGTAAINNDGAPGVKHVYVVLTELTAATVEGFECKITGAGGLLVSYASKVFPVETINVGTRFGEIIAGFANPVMAVDGRAMVMEFDIIVTDASIPGHLFIDPVYFASIDGTPAYLSGGEVLAATNSTAPGLPVLVTNGPEEPVAVDATSFDNLKSLYR